MGFLAAIGLLLGQRQVATQRQHTFGPLEWKSWESRNFSGASPTEKYGRTMIHDWIRWCFPTFSDDLNPTKMNIYNQHVTVFIPVA